MKLILVSVLFFISASMPGNSDCDTLKLSLTITHTSDGKSNGKIEVVVEQGKTPFKVNLFAEKRENNKLDVNFSDLENLPSGKFILIVQDEGKCTFQQEFTIK